MATVIIRYYDGRGIGEGRTEHDFDTKAEAERELDLFGFHRVQGKGRSCWTKRVYRRNHVSTAEAVIV